MGIHFWINFKFGLVWVELRKAKLWVHRFFYKDTKNIKLAISKAIRVFESPYYVFGNLSFLSLYSEVLDSGKAANSKMSLLRWGIFKWSNIWKSILMPKIARIRHQFCWGNGRKWNIVNIQIEPIKSAQIEKGQKC